jgi:hypothetical protein
MSAWPAVAAVGAALLIQTLWLRKRLENNQAETNRKLDHIMALVSIEQSDLDDIATTVSDTADILQGILDSDTPTPPADETALRAAVAKLQGVGPKVAPVEPPVEPPVGA